MHLAQLTALWFMVADGPGGLMGAWMPASRGPSLPQLAPGEPGGGEGGAWGG